jgi:hypothetical protein
LAFGLIPPPQYTHPRPAALLSAPAIDRKSGLSITDASNAAWAAIDAGDPQAAFTALQPHVAAVKTDERVALPWVHLLRFVDARADLTREVRRFARQWLDHPGIILGIAESVAAWAQMRARAKRSGCSRPARVLAGC